jgi:DNA-binding protein H-NS
MSSYKEIQDQIAALQKQAEAIRAEEMNGAVAQIKEIMAAHGISVSDLGTSARTNRKITKPAEVAYQDDSGNTWSGRGRMPNWMKGEDKEKFRVK